MKPDLPQLVVELGVDQVDLAEVGPVGVSPHVGAVPDLLPHVRVALDAEPREQTDLRLARLGQGVGGAPADGDDYAAAGALTFHSCAHDLHRYFVSTASGPSSPAGIFFLLRNW